MAAVSAIKPGIAGVVYRNTATYGSPTWAAITLVRDVSPKFAWDMADASVRGSRAKLFEKTQVDLTTQITARADDLDAGYIALFDAAMSPTSALDLLILDGPIATEGAMGMRAEMKVSMTGQTQGAGDIVYSTFDVSPTWTIAANGYPKSVKMGASSTPSFTSF